MTVHLDSCRDVPNEVKQVPQACKSADCSRILQLKLKCRKLVMLFSSVSQQDITVLIALQLSVEVCACASTDFECTREAEYDEASRRAVEVRACRIEQFELRVCSDT